MQYNLALCQKARGDTRQWLEHLERAQVLDRNNESAGIALGNYYLSAGEYDKALGHYEKWLGSSKNASLVRWNLAVLHTQAGRPEKAIEVLSEIPRSSIFFEDAYTWLARLRDQKERKSVLSLDSSKPRASLLSWLKVPESFVTVLLTVSLILALGGWFPNTKLGPLQIPNFSVQRCRKLKVAGPLIFVLAGVALAPILPLGVSTQKGAQVFELDSGTALARAPATGR